MELSGFWSESPGSRHGLRIALVAMAIGATASVSVISSLLDVARESDVPSVSGRPIVRATIRDQEVSKSSTTEGDQPLAATVPLSPASAIPAREPTAAPTEAGLNEAAPKPEVQSEQTRKGDRLRGKTHSFYWRRSASTRWLDRGSISSQH